MSDTDNMELWDKVCTTDAAHTKYVNQRGGFTAIDAQYQIKTATQQWGPYGTKWGVKDCVYLSLFVKEECAEVALEATFFYPGGEFQLSTEEPWRLKGDTRKKLLTDLTTKCLSKLGFNSDVFEGAFDGNKYTAPDTGGKAQSVDVGSAKKDLLSMVHHKRKDAHREQLQDKAFIVVVSKQVIYKGIIDTEEECAAVRQAIESGDYELDTGEKIPL